MAFRPEERMAELREQMAAQDARAKERAKARLSKKRDGERLPGRKQRGKLTAADVATMIHAKKRGANNAEIARVINVKPATVAKCLEEFDDNRPLAKAKLKHHAVKFVDDAILASSNAADRGDATPALELLDRLDIATKRINADTGAKVMVVVGSSNPASLPDFSAFAIPVSSTQ